MSYADQIKQRRKAGEGKSISTTMIKWEKPGQKFIGKYLSHATLPGKDDPDRTYQQFMFHTDQGYLKCSFGFRGKEYVEQFTKGYLYEVEYLGKVQLEGGRSMNDFRITEFSVQEVDAGASDDDIPF